MIAAVVKIDLVGSKAFSAAMEGKDPAIRQKLFSMLVSIVSTTFPAADIPYPKGSYYKGEGDALYLLLDKPTVAMRAAIEFMQRWFNVRLPDSVQCPDCRVVIDVSDIQHMTTPAASTELFGAAFENISCIEKSLPGGHIYVTAELAKASDRTMTRLSSFQTIAGRGGENIKVYRVAFDDPRSLADSTLMHALFIAHPQAREARDRVVELFLLQYLLERECLTDPKAFNDWCAAKGLPTIATAAVEQICKSSAWIRIDEIGAARTFRLNSAGVGVIEQARVVVDDAKQRCVSTVAATITDKTGTSAAIEVCDLGQLIEEYLCAVFSEIRMMANYFRDSFHLIGHDSKLLATFEYIIRKHVPFGDRRYFETWKIGFIEGLKKAASEHNAFIASIFHNVLATYYVNRSTTYTPYQLSKLRERSVYVDTNILYALRVPASDFHELTKYCFERVNALNIPAFVFPFTLEEFEQSLLFVEREVSRNEGSAFLLQRNPWLFQQFRQNKGRYLSDIGVCRLEHSIAKRTRVDESNYDVLDTKLSELGFRLERDVQRAPDTEIEDRWAKIRIHMASSKWEIDKFMDFIYDSSRSHEKMAHDTNCVENMERKALNTGSDELGPRVLFVTLDRHLARARKNWPFIVNAEQFLEFMMPYFFLSDAPLQESAKFPNQLLSAQLATLLTQKHLEIDDVVSSFFKDPATVEKLEKAESAAPWASDVAMALSSTRFRKLREEAVHLDHSRQEQVAQEIVESLVSSEKQKRTAYFETESAAIIKLREQLADRDKQLDKLQKTVRYWKSQAGRG